MRASKLLAASLAIALGAAAAANAAVIYDNGAPDAFDGNEAVGWVQAEDFKFATARTLTGAGVFLAGYGGVGVWDGAFQYFIFASSGGAPGAVLASGGVTPTVADSGLAWCCGGDAFLFEFDFGSSFLAAADVTYFLGIHAGAGGNFTRDYLYWVTAATNATLRGRQSAGGKFNNWSSTANEHAFFLTGADVPEPATWALMIGGFAATGAVLRRRRARFA